MNSITELMCKIRELSQDHQKRVQVDSAKALDFMEELCHIVSTNDESNCNSHTRIFDRIVKLEKAVYHSAETKQEKINRCPNCGNYEITLYSRGFGASRYGCKECFRRTNYYENAGEAFEAWQVGENG